MCDAFPHGNAKAVRSDRATPGKESDSEDGTRGGRTRSVDVEEAPTCGRLVVVRADRVRVEESHRRGGYRRGLRLPRLGNKRRCCGGVVAADCGSDLRTGRNSARCVVASHRTVVVRRRWAGAPQFAGERPDGSPGQNRHDQQRRYAEHGLAFKRASAVPSKHARKRREERYLPKIWLPDALDFPPTAKNSLRRWLGHQERCRG